MYLWQSLNTRSYIHNRYGHSTLAQHSASERFKKSVDYQWLYTSENLLFGTGGSIFFRKSVIVPKSVKKHVNSFKAKSFSVIIDDLTDFVKMTFKRRRFATGVSQRTIQKCQWKIVKNLSEVIGYQVISEENPN